MKLNVGNGAPVKLEGRARRVKLSRSAVDRAEDVKLVVPQFYRSWVVSLEGRSGLSAQFRDGQYDHEEQRGEDPVHVNRRYR